MRYFNGHIWHAALVLALPTVAVFVLAWWSVWGNAYYFFDPKHSTKLPDAGDFGPHLQRYTDLAKLVITLSAGAIAFLINTLANQKPLVSEFVQRVVDNAPIVVGFFGASIALLIGFLVLITQLYEEYCHDATHTSYKPWKYAVVNSLGWNGLLAFVLAFGWLAYGLFS